jgi:hypothetical protein
MSSATWSEGFRSPNREVDKAFAVAMSPFHGPDGAISGSHEDSQKHSFLESLRRDADQADCANSKTSGSNDRGDYSAVMLKSIGHHSGRLSGSEIVAIVSKVTITLPPSSDPKMAMKGTHGWTLPCQWRIVHLTADDRDARGRSSVASKIFSGRTGRVAGPLKNRQQLASLWWPEPIAPMWHILFHNRQSNPVSPIFRRLLVLAGWYHSTDSLEST